MYRPFLSLLSLFSLTFSPLQGGQDLAFDSSAEVILTSELEPISTVAGCVSLESGSFFISECDLSVGLPSHPLTFSRSYDYKLRWKSFIGAGCGTNLATSIDYLVHEKSGLYRTYLEFNRENARVSLKGGHAKEIAGKKRIDFSFSSSKLPRGVTNLAFGEISGRTSPINIRAQLQYTKWENKEKDGKWIVTLGDGTKQYYDCIDQYDHNGVLRYEVFPNGNKRHYSYTIRDEDYAPTKIWDTNADETKTIAELSFSYPQGKECIVTASNGLVISYLIKKQTFVTQKIITYKGGDGVTHKQLVPEYNDHNILKEIRADHIPSAVYRIPDSTPGSEIHGMFKPNHRFLYQKGGTTWTERLYAPVGTDEEAIEIYKFDYGNKHRETTVKDAHGNLSKYTFNDDKRVTTIREYEGKKLYRGTKVFWNSKGWMVGKSRRDSSKKMFRSTTLAYDYSGNITKKTLYGNLTGKGVKTFKVDSGGWPDSDQKVELCRSYYEYGPLNLVTKEYDDFGKEVLYFYHPNTNLIIKKLTKEHGEITKRVFNEYDDCAVLIQSIEDDGSGEALNDLSDVTIRKFRTIKPSQELCSFGKPLEIEDSYLDLATGKQCLLKRACYTYNANGLPIEEKIYDANDKLTYESTSIYDQRQLLIASTDALGVVTKYEYDANHNKIYEERVGSGKVTHYNYDFSDRLIAQEEIHEDGSVQTIKHAYDYLHNRTSTEDSFGNVTKYEYDGFNRLISTTKPKMLGPKGQIITPKQILFYDCADNVIAAVDELENVTQSTYNVYGNPVTILHPNGTEEFSYLKNGWLAWKREASGSETTYTHDAAGRVIHEITTDADGTFLKEISRHYKGDLLMREEDSTKCPVDYRYDGAGRKIEDQRGDHRTTYAYDPLGRLWKITSWLSDGTSKVEIKEYDLLNRLIEERIEDHKGNIQRKTGYEYDINGNRTHEHRYITTHQCDTTVTLYNSHNLPIKITDALGNEAHITYDFSYENEIGQEVLQKVTTDPLGTQTIEIYDAHHRIISIDQRDPIGRRIAYSTSTYDARGDEIQTTYQIIENLENIGEYAIDRLYDPMRNPIEVIEQQQSKSPKRTVYSYDEANRLQALTKPDGVVIAYTYNGLGHTTSQISSDGSIEYYYDYDAHYNPIAVTNAIHNRQTHRIYDPFDKVTSEHLANGLSLTFTYDSLSRVKIVTYPDQTGAQYHYNGIDLTAVSRHNSGNSESYRHSYKSYDLQGQLLKANRAKGASNLTCTWDSLGRRVKTSTSKWSQTLDQFDAAGNLLRATQGDHTTDYSYDALYQLTKEAGHIPHDYSYDSINNRRSKDAVNHTISHLNQVTHDGQADYRYDPQGNLIEKEANGELTTYRYDALDRLTSVEMPHLTVSYAYDDEGRRLWKRLSTGEEQRFLYHGSNEIGSYDIEDNPIDFRLLGRGKGGEIGASIAIELKSDTYLPVHDHRGNITCLETTWGCHARTYYYDAYGIVYNESGQELPQTPQGNPWRFSSKRHDPHTHLVHFGARDYDPHLGRWLTPDPAGFADGPNLYAYVHNAPMTHYDPYGLFSFSESGWSLKDFDLGLKDQSVSAISVCQGTAHGTVDFGYSNVEAWLWGAHFIGAGNISDNLLTHEERMAMHDYHAEQMDKLSTWVESGTQNLLGIDPNDVVYQNTRYATSTGLEVASFAYGGYAIGKGILKGSMKASGRLAKQSIKGGLREASLPAALAQKGLKIENGLAKGITSSPRLSPGNNLANLTPKRFFGGKTSSEMEQILMNKFGPPRGGGIYNKSFYNYRTQRTFNLHWDPSHRGGRPHVDIRRRGLDSDYYKNTPFFLKE